MIVFQHAAATVLPHIRILPKINSSRKTINARSPSAPLTLDNGVMGRPIYQKINFIYPLIVFEFPIHRPPALALYPSDMWKVFQVPTAFDSNIFGSYPSELLF